MKRKSLATRKTINSMVFLVSHRDSVKSVQKFFYGAWQFLFMIIHAATIFCVKMHCKFSIFICVPILADSKSNKEGTKPSQNIHSECRLFSA